MAQRYTFNMNSGDILVFDPSSEAAIVHGVAGVFPAGDKAGGKQGLAVVIAAVCTDQRDSACISLASQGTR